MTNAKTLAGYAKALFEVAQEENAAQECYDQLVEFVPAISSELIAFAENPGFHASEKSQVVDDIAKRMSFSPSVRAFVLLLVEHRMLRRLSGILHFYRKVLFQSQGKKLVRVRSAQPLGGEQAKSIEEVIRKKIQSPFEMETSVEPKLIGGVVVEMDSQIYDGSVRGRIQQLRETLLA